MPQGVPVCGKLNLQKQGHSGQNPLGWAFFGLEVERPHVGGSPLTGLVHGAGVDAAGILLVHGDGFEEHHGHGGR